VPRITAYLIALVLTVGPGGGSALCRAWCDREAASSELCHDTAGIAELGLSETSSTGNAGCWLLAPESSTRTDERRRASESPRHVDALALQLLIASVPLGFDPTPLMTRGPQFSAPSLHAVLRL
jgi:hypothetical protein